jgi:hypothetical protein
MVVLLYGDFVGIGLDGEELKGCVVMTSSGSMRRIAFLTSREAHDSLRHAKFQGCGGPYEVLVRAELHRGVSSVCNGPAKKYSVFIEGACGVPLERFARQSSPGGGLHARYFCPWPVRCNNYAAASRNNGSFRSLFRVFADRAMCYGLGKRTCMPR